MPEKTEYAYKLEGFNEGWMTTAFGKVTYTNLAPGTYMLKVKAVNSDGYGGDEEASLKIVIYPPFWRSVWAYVVYSLLLVAVLILGRYWILRGERDKFKKQQIKQEIERNQEKADMKLKFFTPTPCAVYSCIICAFTAIGAIIAFISKHSIIEQAQSSIIL